MAIDATDEEKYHNTLQRLGTYFLIRKTPKTVDFVNKWLELSQDYDLISDKFTKDGHNKGFRHHKHDQSILSLLSKVHGIKSFEDIGDPKSSTTIAASKRSSDKKREDIEKEIKK